MLLWLAGWSGLADRLTNDPISRALLRMKGVGVATSATLAPLGTAYGVWAVNHSAAAAAVAAAVVLALVVVADRYAVFAADTQSKLKRSAFFRLPLALMISLLTTYAVFVFLNGEHLTAVASDMRLERAEQRAKKLDGSIGIEGLHIADRDARDRFANLRKQRLTLPENIAQEKAAGEACAREVERRLDALLKRGMNRRDAANSVEAARERCNRLIRAAEGEERIYFDSLDADLQRARTVADAAATALAAALVRKDELAEQSSAIDAGAIAPVSLAVVMRYLSQNWLAVVELIAIYGAICVCDAAGLLMASILGRSPAGHELERERRCAIATGMADLVNAHQQILQAESLMRQTSRAATRDNTVPFIEQQLASVNQAMAAESARAAKRAAPFVAAAASINAIVAAYCQAEEAAQRAHAIDPALGLLADRHMQRAANETFGEMAA